MSRRCAREGVAWPRMGYAVESGADPLFARLWWLTMTVPGAWSDDDDARAARGRDHARVMEHLRRDAVSRATVAEVVVLSAALDGGPVLCGTCVTAWRADLARCPACCSALTGERGTALARAVYAAQRRDDAPLPHDPTWREWVTRAIGEVLA